MKLPKKITPCPIIDTNIEIRFDSDLLSDAIFGVIYNSIKSEYPKVEKLPILQLPDEIRFNDPNLISQPYYKLSNDTFVLQIGPKMLSLGSNIEYIGWKKYYQKLTESFLVVKELKIIKQIIRLGIRYVNFFNFNIFEHVNLKITHNDTMLKSERIMLSTEIVDGKFVNLLRIANRANVSSIKKVGSVIDIDTHIVEPMENFFDKMELLLQQGHEAEKKLFFSLLKDEYLQTLNPEY